MFCKENINKAVYIFYSPPLKKALIMTFVKSNVTLNGRAFLIAWSILLILFFVIIGTFSLTKIDNLKKTSAARHADRMSASRIEAGRTAPELTLPAGSNPEKVQVGVYLDHLASISVAENTWSPEFYLWFKWSNDAINPGDTFDIIEGILGIPSIL